MFALASSLVIPAIGGEERMTLLPAGTYRPFFVDKAAKPGEQRAIAVSAFWMDRYPVTLTQFRRFIRSNPDWRRSRVKHLVAIV